MSDPKIGQVVINLAVASFNIINTNLRFFILHFLAITLAALLYLLRSVIQNNQQTLIFVATRHHAEYLKEVKFSYYSIGEKIF